MSVAAVKGNFEQLPRICHLAAVQRFAADVGLCHKPPPAGFVVRRPGRLIAAIRMRAISARRTIARPSSGSMHDGDCRKADGPQAPDNSSIIHDDPADAVPYIGSSRASVWSLQGPASLRSFLDGHDDGFAKKPRE